MALTYYSGNAGQCFVVGLSTDTKPAPTSGFTFLASDTGQTFIANGVSWVPSGNHAIVASISDFPPPSAGVITLVDNTAYIITGTVDISPNRIVCGIKNSIIGLDRINDKITSSTASALFTVDSTTTAKVSLVLQDVGLSAPSGTLLNDILTGVAFIQCAFSGGSATLGTINQCPSFTLRNCGVSATTVSGFAFTGASGKVQVRDNVVSGNAGILIDLGTAVFDTVDIGRNVVAVSGGQTFMSGAAAGANVTIAGHVNNNIFSGAGTPIAVILPTDPNWLWSGNAGITNTAVAPAAHATSHKSGGTDAIKLDELAAPTDITTLNATTALHGLLRKLDGLTTTFLRGDGTWAVPPGGGGGANVGTATIDFGAFPGSPDASVAVTGQAAIAAGSVVQAWLRPTATADHSADEHMLETLKVVAGNIIAGTGFTIYGFSTNQINEPDPEPAQLLGRFSGTGAALGGGGRDLQVKAISTGTRIYGQWTVAWSWT